MCGLQRVLNLNGYDYDLLLKVNLIHIESLPNVQCFRQAAVGVCAGEAIDVKSIDVEVLGSYNWGRCCRGMRKRGYRRRIYRRRGPQNL